MCYRRLHRLPKGNSILAQEEGQATLWPRIKRWETRTWGKAGGKIEVTLIRLESGLKFRARVRREASSELRLGLGPRSSAEVAISTDQPSCRNSAPQRPSGGISRILGGSRTRVRLDLLCSTQTTSITACLSLLPITSHRHETKTEAAIKLWQVDHVSRLPLTPLSCLLDFKAVFLHELIRPVQTPPCYA